MIGLAVETVNWDCRFISHVLHSRLFHYLTAISAKAVNRSGDWLIGRAGTERGGKKWIIKINTHQYIGSIVSVINNSSNLRCHALTHISACQDVEIAVPHMFFYARHHSAVYHLKYPCSRWTPTAIQFNNDSWWWTNC